MTPEQLDEHERNLKRWLHLLSVDDSREHRSPAMASGGCFKAHGERGCPCCDAHDDLAGDMPEMIQVVGALVDEVRRLRDIVRDIDFFWNQRQSGIAHEAYQDGKGLDDWSPTVELYKRVRDVMTEEKVATGRGREP